ncbi:hypothetical protein [Jannaschia marina]|uniref:hypothetical protein n=1 Tax=Jannaschia marina TaxID=2741674 RepID=UPI0015C9F96B|nr:hypothetical protein [Jannaschia marina]
MSRAMWDRDHDTVARLHEIPHVILHPDGPKTFETFEALSEAARQFRDHLDGLGATGFHRVCEQASFDPLNADRITGVHWSYILRGGNYLTEPYSCQMELLRDGDGRWFTRNCIVPGLRHGIPTPDSDDGTDTGGSTA